MVNLKDLTTVTNMEDVKITQETTSLGYKSEIIIYGRDGKFITVISSVSSKGEELAKQNVYKKTAHLLRRAIRTYDEKDAFSDAARFKQGEITKRDLESIVRKISPLIHSDKIKREIKEL